ncbi:M16 family metallopeptidase [Rhodalgimonas zhirmunskyi]|uniref:Insulinase family protein n=1 Tax=Rhodalgimonas zhirmunskyi TaxID=2964767 RepID=A0AAJ1X533_9RHOB|nr:pitrilysin family protein [Rhodoalgimonas zhirmunskyi]MDQ2093754.1 insulinase family protein [Rhodoalgimonas zhirmunskyi]
MSVQQTTLSNGFRIVSERMPSLQSAAVGIWITAGGRNEREEENGIAHFLEHMAFKGTAKRTTLEIAEAIEDVGGYINAYTSREATAYYARVLGGDVPLALDVLADILMNPVFDPAEIEVERHVILQEIGQALDTPDDVIFDWLQEKAYPGQPIGRTILGLPERVKGFGRADFEKFTAEHYGPGQMILAAAGDVDHDALVKLAEGYFGTMSPKPQATPDVARFVGGEVRRDKKLEQAHMALAFEAPDYRDPLIYTAQVYSNALGGGMSSRLFQEIREKRGLCYTIFAQTGAYSDAGLMTIYAGTSGEEMPELMRITLDEMRRAADDMSAEEVERARTQMRAGMLMGLESPTNRAERMARMVQTWNRVPDPTEIVEKIDAVTLEGVRDFGAEMISRSGAALALYGPVADAPGLDLLSQRRAA